MSLICLYLGKNTVNGFMKSPWKELWNTLVHTILGTYPERGKRPLVFTACCLFPCFATLKLYIYYFCFCFVVLSLLLISLPFLLIFVLENFGHRDPLFSWKGLWFSIYSLWHLFVLSFWSSSPVGSRHLYGIGGECAWWFQVKCSTSFSFICFSFFPKVSTNCSSFFLFALCFSRQI